MSANPQLGAAITAFLDDGALRGLSPRTLEGYREVLRRVASHLPAEASLAELTLDAARGWLAAQPHLRPASRANYARVLRVFSAWAASEYRLAESPLGRLPVPRVASAQPDPFSPAQLDALLAVASPPLAFAIVLLVETGLRSSEAIGVRLADLREDTIVVRHAKGGTPRVVPVSPPLAHALRHYLSTVRPYLAPPGETSLLVGRTGRPLTPRGLRRTIARAAVRAKLVGVRASPHTLRHTFAHDTIAAGAPMLFVQAVLGHRSSAMLARYVKASTADLTTVAARSPLSRRAR